MTERAIKRPPRLHPYLYVYRNQIDEFWWCAIPYMNENGRRRQRRRTFRDSDYGSSAQALHQAQTWRDEQIKNPEVRIAMGDRRPLVLYARKDRSDLGSGANPFGLVGITATFRDQPLGGNFSVTANRGRKKWFSMRRYGTYEAFRRAVAQRCEWLGIPTPPEAELHRRYRPWAERNLDLLQRHDLAP